MVLHLARWLALGLLALIVLASMGLARTASNTVPVSRAIDTTIPVRLQTQCPIPRATFGYGVVVGQVNGDDGDDDGDDGDGRRCRRRTPTAAVPGYGAPWAAGTPTASAPATTPAATPPNSRTQPVSGLP